MLKSFKPMLAAKDASKLVFPLCASPKIDGVRAVVLDGIVYSRSLKPIPNPHVQRLFGRPELEGLDGELVVGGATAPDCMQATTSGVMSKSGEPDVRFYVFDSIDTSMVDLAPFVVRIMRAEASVRAYEKRCLLSDDWSCPVVFVTHPRMESQEQLDAYEREMLDRGYEGVMCRALEGQYKFGRSTAKEGGLVKVKRFAYEEAEVVGYEERCHNENEATVDALGHTKRSTHAAGKRPAGDLGALKCRVFRGQSSVEFSVGTGFSAEQRREFWARRSELVGQSITFRHFAVTGVLDAPRFPIFVALRSPLDMDPEPYSGPGGAECPGS